MKKTRFVALTASLAGLALVLAGCSNADTGTDSESPAPDASPESNDLIHVTYGSFPTNPVASIQYAINEGVFEAHGIDLEVIVGGGSSAAQLPALSTGDLHFMLASPVTALTASTQGLDIRIVSGVIENAPEVVEDAAAVIVGPGSDIVSAKDLSGKRVAVNALGSVGEIGIREAVALDGGDPDSIQFVQLSFPEINAQLETGQIDAGMNVSPFMDTMFADGGAMVNDFITEVGLGQNELVTITGGKLAEENPELIEKFQAAWKEASELINENNDAVRDLIPEALGMPVEVAENVKLAKHGYEIYPETIQLFADLLTKYEIVDDVPDVNSVIIQ